MKQLLPTIFLFLTISSFLSNASVDQQPLKKGASVTLDIFKGAKAIKRSVPAGEQVFHLEGPNIGSFVDENGKKIETDSSNYLVKNGVLFIKSFTEADVGSYSEEPTKIIKSKNKDRTEGAVLGPTLHLFIE